MSARFDVLVVGAGPAGIAAAVRAAESGARVALLDDNPASGGQIWRSGAQSPSAARKWLAKLDASQVERLQGWHVFDHPQPGLLFAERNSPAAPACAGFRYDRLVLATGARERFLPFPGWTLPNVMGAGGLDAMARSGLPVQGKRVVIAGTGPLLLAVAAHLAMRGAKIIAVCEQASLSRLAAFGGSLITQPGKLAQAFQLRASLQQAHFYTGCWIVEAKGSGALESLTLQQNGKRWYMSCDYLGCGYHLVPNLELPRLLGCRLQSGFVEVDLCQQTSILGVYCAGEPTGIGGVELAIIEGQIAGLAASGRSNEAQDLMRKKTSDERFVNALAKAFALDPRLRGLPTDDTIVCRCEDVRFGALREHTASRDAKLQTRCGMGPCQGRVCGAATEFLFGWAADSVRPPILPACIASLHAETDLPANVIPTEKRKETL